MCCLFERRTLIVAVGSSDYSIHIGVSSAPNCLQKKLVLAGGESAYVPVSLLDAGPMISSTVRVVVRNDRTGKILNTYLSFPHSLAHYKEIRLTVGVPFEIEFVFAPPGFWLNVLRLFSFGFRTTRNANRGRPNDYLSSDIESQPEAVTPPIAIDNSSYNTENSPDFNNDASSFKSRFSSPGDNIIPTEENVREFEARSSSFVGPILHFSKRFLGII